MFDLEKVKKESGLTQEQLIQLEAAIRQEFPHDEMMFELHFIRTLEAIRKGWITPHVALAEKVH